VPIRIESKKDGFRRCGIPHPSKPTTYPDDRFSDEELKVLRDEPMLVVTKISKKEAEAQSEEDNTGTGEVDYESMTVKELKELCKGMDLSTKGKKAELIERLEEAEGE